MLAESYERPLSGFSYAEINLLPFRATKIRILQIPSLPLIYTLSTAIKSLNFEIKHWSVENEYTGVIFDSYYNGIKANHYTSKYFHWFLIIEAIEKSNRYGREFQELLFDSSELDTIVD